MLVTLSIGVIAGCGSSHQASPSGNNSSPSPSTATGASRSAGATGSPSPTASASTSGPASGRSSAPSKPPAKGSSARPHHSTKPSPAQKPAPVENNPPGDIPDNIAYVPYTNHQGRYAFVHPEGWARIVLGPTVTFTDKLNGVTATARPATKVPTVLSVQQTITDLKISEPAFELRSVKPASLPAGTGVLIVFRRNSASDPVTGKVFRDEVQRYMIFHAGRLITLDLYGAVGSDNVDPYTKISQSLRVS